MTVTPRGPLSKSLEVFRHTLADCPSFRAWCGAAGQDAALARIHRNRLPKPADGRAYTAAELAGYRPFATIGVDLTAGFRSVRTSLGGFTRAGRFQAVLIATVDAEEFDVDGPSLDACAEWDNFIGNLVADVESLRDRGGYLAVNDIQIDEGPYIVEADRIQHEGLWQGVTLGVTWGSL